MRKSGVLERSVRAVQDMHGCTETIVCGRSDRLVKSEFEKLPLRASQAGRRGLTLWNIMFAYDVSVYTGSCGGFLCREKE